MFIDSIFNFVQVESNQSGRYESYTEVLVNERPSFLLGRTIGAGRSLSKHTRARHVVFFSEEYRYFLLKVNDT